MQISESDIDEITQTVWTATLDLEAYPLGALDDSTVAWLDSHVQISGAWEGTVMLRCTPGLARRAAGILFQLEPDEASEEDVVDTLGELVNIIGGNVKALVPTPSTLSLPAVEAEARVGPPLPEAPISLSVYDCGGELFLVSVHEGL